MKKLLILLIILLTIPATAAAGELRWDVTANDPPAGQTCQCAGPGDCTCTVSQCRCENCTAMRQAAATRYEWRRYNDPAVTDYALLYDKATGKQLGCYCISEGCYRKVSPDGRTYGPTCYRPPVTPPASPVGLPAAVPVSQSAAPFAPAQYFYYSQQPMSFSGFSSTCRGGG